MLARRISAIFISSFFLITASAAGYGNSGLGDTVVGGGGGGGGGGMVQWFDLKNTNFAANEPGVPGGIGGGVARTNLRYPGQVLNAWRQQSASKKPGGREALWRRATNRVMAESCGSPVNSPSPRATCPLWWNTTGRSSSSNPSTWLQVHAVMPDPQSTADGGIAGQIAGYNIRVWRENLRANGGNGGWELIMQRQVGAAGRNTEKMGVSAATANRYWWYGGNTDKATGKNTPGDKVLGGSYSMPGGGGRTVLGAGMIGNGQGSSARKRCLNNLSAGINYNGAPKKRQKLRNRILGGRTCYWEGNQMGPLPFSYRKSGVRQIWGDIPRNNAPDNQFGPNTERCFLGASCAGRRESLTFSWSIPSSAQSNRKQTTRWRFKLRGAPGLYYAVQIVAIDSREGIVPMRKPEKYVWTTREGNNDSGNSGQFMQVYISSPVPDDIIKSEFSSDERDYSALLEGDELRQAREIGEYSVSLDTTEESDEANNESPNFPREVLFQHFTPQLQHSSQAVANLAAGAPGGPPGSASGNGQLYSERHVKYYDVRGVADHLDSVPGDWPLPPTAGGFAPSPPKMVSLKRAIALNPQDPSSDSYTWTTRISWLRATLDNPCSPSNAQGVNYPYDPNTTKWPTKPNRCQPTAGGSNVFNAWDDFIGGDASWDAQRVIRKIDNRGSGSARGMVSNQLLRCNVGDGRVAPAPAESKPENYNLLTNPNQKVAGGTSGNGAEPGNSGFGYTDQSQYGDGTDTYTRCQNTIYPLIDGVVQSSGVQKAQGVIDIQPEGSAQRGPAYITFDTNRFWNVNQSAVKLYARDDSGIVVSPYAQSRLINSNPEQLELNFCRQGVPQRVARNNGEYAEVRYRSNNGIQNVPASFAGDSNCRGYVQWFKQKTGRFAPYGSEQWGKCWTNLPGRSSQARLNFLRQRRGAYFGNMDNNSANGSYGRSGLNGDRGGPRTQAYGNSFPTGRSPFIFKAPWEINGQQWQRNENSFKDCNRPERDRWIEGKWVRDQWVPGYWTYKVVNGKQVRDQWIKGYWTYKWQPGYWTYKNVRGYSMAGQWRIHGNAQPQRGWGAANSGPPLVKRAYLVDIPFYGDAPGGFEDLGGSAGGPVTGTSINSGQNSCPKIWQTTKRPKTCWTLKASYEGLTNYIRVSINRRTADPAHMFVKVYGNRGIR